MRNELNPFAVPRGAISRIAHIIERVGLAMAGALCGLFVAAEMMRANSDELETTGFVMTMCLFGITGFYLGIDTPRLRARGLPRKRSSVELLSGFGTFLTAMAALVSVTLIILDEPPELTPTILIGCAWLFGATMQIGAGAIARLD